VVNKIDELWIIAENKWQKRGLVPLSYVTILIKEFSEFTKDFAIKKVQLMKSNTKCQNLFTTESKIEEDEKLNSSEAKPSIAVLKPPIAPKPKIDHKKIEIVSKTIETNKFITVKDEAISQIETENNALADTNLLKNADKRFIERKYSIDELYQTEKDFCKELTFLYDAFINDIETVSII